MSDHVEDGFDFGYHIHIKKAGGREARRISCPLTPGASSSLESIRTYLHDRVDEIVGEMKDEEDLSKSRPAPETKAKAAQKENEGPK